jgi:hypothetical protein
MWRIRRANDSSWGWLDQTSLALRCPRGFMMLAMIRRLFGFSHSEPTLHDRSLAQRLDSFCSNSATGSYPAIAAASELRQSTADPAANTDARPPYAAVSAPRGSTPASDDPAANWLEMRRSAGWTTLENKPDGRDLFRSAEELERLRHSGQPQHADPGSDVVESSLAAPELERDPPDSETQTFPSAMPPKNPRTAAEEAPVAAAASTALHTTASHSILAERRAARRYAASQVHGHLKIVESSCKSPVILRDISTLGISLVLRVQHQIGTPLQLTITSNSYGMTGPVQAQVVRIVRLANGQWLTCCVFETPLDDGWLRTLIRQG